MQKIIGLDIGSYSIKAVEINNSFYSYNISNFYEKIIPINEIKTTNNPKNPATGIDTSYDQLVVDCIKQMFDSYQLTPDRVVTSMPGQYTTSRMLSFPFADYSKISASVEFAVEDLVPFSLEDMVLDYQILDTQGKNTKVLAVLVIKKYLSNFLENLSNVDIDPKSVDVDSLSLYNLAFNLPAEDQEKLIGIVDIGHTKTSVCILDNCNLQMFRTLKVGGKYITEVLARNNEMSFEEAQQLKHTVQAIGVDEQSLETFNLIPEHKQIAMQIGSAGYSFSKDLVRTLLAYKSQQKRPLDHIYLSGGSCKLRGIENYLSAQLSVDVKKLDIDKCDLQIEPKLKKHSIVIPQALSIGLRAVSSSKKSSKINLRKGEFAYSHDSQKILDVLSRVFKWTAAGIFLLFLGYGLQHAFYKHQITKFDQLYRKQITNLDQKLASSINQYKSFSALKTFVEQSLNLSIESTKSGVDSFMSNHSGSPALIALMILSKIIPNDLTVEFVSYEFSTANQNSGALKILGETDGYGSVSKIKELIIAHESFTEVTEKSNSKPGSDGKVIAFTILTKFLSNI